MTKAICSLFIRPSNPSPWLPTRCSTALLAVRSCSTPSSDQGRSYRRSHQCRLRFGLYFFTVNEQVRHRAIKAKDAPDQPRARYICQGTGAAADMAHVDHILPDRQVIKLYRGCMYRESGQCLNYYTITNGLIERMELGDQSDDGQTILAQGQSHRPADRHRQRRWPGA